jgi:nucleoside-diphosphate-sugar epimerase
MKILITGAAGFLGFHLSTALEKKHTLTLVDIVDLPNPLANSVFHRLDIRDKAGITDLSKGQDVIIHAAAALPLWKPKDILSTNVDGTENLLAAAKTHKIKRFIYISSTAVYGVPKIHPIHETDPLVGVGHYGDSKILAEKHCLNYLFSGMSVTILRPKTFLGTGRLGVFEILFDWIHDGKKVPVIGSGQNRYQLLAVDDLVDVTGRFAEAEGEQFNGVFNVAAEEFKTVREDLEELFAYAKSGSRLFPTWAAPIKTLLFVLEKMRLSPLYQWVYDTADKDSFVSIEKLKTTLNWQPRYSNAQILIKTYQWYLDNYSQIKSQESGITHTVAWKQGMLGLIKKFM